MSYDIYLKDKYSGETIQLPYPHLMTGGTFMADYDEKTNTFSPSPITDAWLNITYNYAHYYYEATENDDRFAHDEISYCNTNSTNGQIKTEYGIRGIYGKTGLESIPMLEDMINKIKTKYRKDDDWIYTQREKYRHYNKEGEIVNQNEYFNAILNGTSNDYTSEKYFDIVYEGPNDNYWEATAVNAIKPLEQLLIMAKLRPDGIWEGD
jgi:hypothetical protein